MFTREAMTGRFAPTEGRWRDTAVVESGDARLAQGKYAEMWTRRFKSEGDVPSASALGAW